MNTFFFKNNKNRIIEHKNKKNIGIYIYIYLKLHPKI